MSTAGQFSSRNPTIKRILKEASELANQPSAEYHAAPLETDLFEWHFTLRGPPAPSPYEGGIYHGRIVLPPAYPLKPPSFRFLTPTGRFEVNREICLSISGHHEETWQPAWGIRTALVAIRSFMDTDAKGQLGGMDASEEVRRRFAAQSKTSKCATCGRTNDEIMREQDEVVKEHGGEGKAETVPDELRLAYREDLGKANGKPDGPDASAAEKATTTSSPPAPADTPVNSVPAAATSTETDVRQRQRPLNPPPATATVNLPPIAGHQRDDVPGWVDKAIYGILAVLIFLLCKRIAA